MAISIVCSLRGDAAAAVEKLWRDIEERWGVIRSHRLAPPHITLAIVRGDRMADVDRVVTAVASTHRPFTVTGGGYGIFVGAKAESPVVHLAVTRTPELSALQAAVTDGLTAARLDLDGQCAPDRWRPHVTLADAGLDAALVGRIASLLVEEGPRRWTLEIDNLGVAPGTGPMTIERALTDS